MRLGEAADVVRGVSFDKSDIRNNPSQGYIPIIRAGNIQDFVDIEHNLIWIPDKRVNHAQKLQKNDIVMCASSGSADVVGKSAILPNGWYGSVGAFCVIIRAEGSICEPVFLSYFLRSSSFRAWASRSQGINIKNIKKRELENLAIPLPPLDEQRRIVEVLERAAGIRRRREQALDKARALIPALFLDMFGDARRIFERFSRKRLDTVAEIGSGVTKGRKLNGAATVDLPYLRVANVQDGFLDLSEIKTIPATARDRERYALQAGDLLMTEGGDPDKLGRAAIWRDEIPDCLHQNHIFRVRPRRGHVLPDYLANLAGSSYGKAYFLSVAKRTTGIASINKTQLSAFPVPLPSLDIQRAFAERVADIRAIIAHQEQSLDAARALERSLMARLLG